MDHQKWDYVSCPFSRQHRVLRPHLQRHIIKCMKNYPDFVPCIYNETHWFQSKEDMMAHIKDCPSRRLVDRQSEKRSDDEDPIPNSVFDSKKFHTREENWDDEYV